MKKSELFFTAILVPIDFCMVLLAGIAAYSLRFTPIVTGIRPVFYDIAFSEFLRITLVVGVIFLSIFAISGLYAAHSFGKRNIELGKIFIACTASITVVVLVIFFQRELFSSRFIIIAGWIFSIVLVSLGRLAIRLVQHALLRRGVGSHQVIIIGNDEITENVLTILHRNSSYGYKVIDRFSTVDDATITTLKERMKLQPVDEVIVADPALSKQQMLQIKGFCDEHHVVFKYAADLYETQATNVEVTTIADIPLIEVKRTKLDGWGRILKRIFDLVFSSFLLLVLTPIFLLIALFIRIDSEGPIFVKLERVGERGNRFTLYKFRSMIKDAHALKKQLVNFNERSDGPLFKIKNDPRITRFGRLLRKSSLDELPQLFNVLKGEMSLVGPRPHEPEEVDKYEKSHKKLLTIKPGLTGFAQISGRSELKFEDEAKLDIYYIENWSLAFDLRILAKTPFVVFLARSAA